MLLAHEGKIARRQPTSGRPGIAPRRERLALGIRKALGKALPAAPAIGLQMVPPAGAEIGLEVLDGGLGMDIDIDDLGARPLLTDEPNRLDIHRASSFNRA
jgi:hypothetical protein